MADVTIRVRPNGPLLVEGAVEIVDQHGNPYPRNKEKPAVALCRCGHTNNRPFCDGTHKTTGWECPATAPATPP